MDYFPFQLVLHGLCMGFFCGNAYKKHIATNGKQQPV